MRIAKRILLFATVNLLIVLTLTAVLGALGVGPRYGGRQLSLEALAAFALVWGFGSALISLALSRVMAKWMMGVQVVDPRTEAPAERELVEAVHRYARQAGLRVMPEVGVYDSPELNAFATGPTRNRALVAVSTGLLERMDRAQVEGVIAHEVAHVANGDMVTMTLVQGVVNAFVIFAARALAWVAGQFAEEDKRSAIEFAISLVLELVLGLLGMMVVARVSRSREYRADAGGAALAGPARMIAALRGLQAACQAGAPELVDDGRAPALASLKISGRAGGLLKLLSTHPDLEDRIRRLEELRHGGRAKLGGSAVLVSG